MNVQQFLEHHRLMRNPFSEEDAQTDPVFKEHCLESTRHPAWDKVSGDPNEPSTSIVFGPKGSGKTAMRLQLDRFIAQHNRQAPYRRAFVIHYDDFNSFLGQFQKRIWWGSKKKPEKILQQWKLWDHIDAVLCQGVSDLVGRILQSRGSSNLPEDLIRQTDVDRLDRGQCRDILLLSLLYDQSTIGSFDERFRELRRRLGYQNWKTWFDFSGGVIASVLVTCFTLWLFRSDYIKFSTTAYLTLFLVLASWVPYGIRLVRNLWRAIKIRRHLRVGRRTLGQLVSALQQIPNEELASQPMPTAPRTDDRYALLDKFQGNLKTLGFTGLLVLVDRVDEPHLINGQPERMRLFIWPLLDNKLLKHPGLGLKMMLPYELHHFIEREGRDFYEKARLDKQNVVSNFAWTGESLYDLVGARLAACLVTDAKIEPEQLFDESVTRARLMAAMQSLQVPRNLFRFLYKLLIEHCNRYSTVEPKYRISSEVFESTLALFQRELQQMQGQ